MAAIKAALAAIESLGPGERLNYTQTAKEYDNPIKTTPACTAISLTPALKINDSPMTHKLYSL